MIIQKVLLGCLLVSSLCLAFARNTFHSALYLIVSFIIGGIFISSITFSLIGLILIIVYAGAVATLFLFSSMMIGQEEESNNNSKIFKSMRVLLISFALIVAYSAFYYNKIGEVLIKENLDPNYKNIAVNLYDNFDMAFQALGIVLLLAVFATHIVKSTQKKVVSKQMDPAKQVSHIAKIHLVSNKKELKEKL
jgi:NADH-quinone oxidoreductase subunit J